MYGDAIDLYRQWTIGRATDTKKETLEAENVQRLPLAAPEIKAKVQTYPFLMTSPNLWKWMDGWLVGWLVQQ
jgi:hypothetical protein